MTSQKPQKDKKPRVPNFIKTLLKIINSKLNKINNFITWRRNYIFIQKNSQNFEKLLKIYYKRDHKFLNFIRKLHGHGFQSRGTVGDSKSKNDEKNNFAFDSKFPPGTQIFFHPYFIKNMPLDLTKIFSRTTERFDMKKKRRSTNGASFSGITFHSFDGCLDDIHPSVFSLSEDLCIRV